MQLTRIVSTIFAAAALVTASGTAGALVHFDFEQNYFNEPGQPVLDHCLVEDGGLIHLFYLRGNPAIDIGHATTTDFVHWEMRPPLLSPGAPGEFDDKALWAPHVIRHNNFWYMFYTGVNSLLSQQSGLAAGLDLDNWFKFPGPRYHPDNTRWAEWTATAFTHGRDPHVVAYDGKFYMFVTAKTWFNEGAVACAESNDLVNWTDIGPVFVNVSWHVMESVFMLPKDGRWHMFFTEEVFNGTSHMSSDSLLSGWDISQRQVIDVGHAPQVTVLSSGAEIFSRHSIYNNGQGVQLYNLRFDTLTWIGDIPVANKPWPLAQDWEVIQGNAFPFQPTYGNNPLARGDTVDTKHQGDSWVGTYELYTGPMGFGSPGQWQGEGPTGIIRSRPFSITGFSMNLLVSGGDYPNECYVAIVDNSTGEALFSETGKNTDEMDPRTWDLAAHVGKTVYIEIADLSSDVFGHINVDDITESWVRLSDPPAEEEGNGTGNEKDTKGLGSTSGMATTPKKSSLQQNTPNPFNPITTIGFELAEPGHVRLEIFDVSGRRVRTLVNKAVGAGTRSVKWDGRDVTGLAARSGVYFYRLSVDGSVVATRKMVLLK